MSQAGLVDVEGSHPQIPTLFVTDSGTAIPIANILEVIGGTNVTTSGSGNTIVITATGGGGGGIADIHCDVGTASGNIITVLATPDCGSSVAFVGDNINTINLNVTDGSLNTIIGNSSGVLVNSASSCTGLGAQVLASITDDDNHVAIGRGALQSANDSSSNTAVGAYALNGVVSGGDNTAVGAHAGISLSNGNFNTMLGYFAGVNYTGSESSNILLGNQGIASESNILRIGDTGSGALQQNQCYIAAISGSSVAVPKSVVIGASTEQVGTLDQTDGQILIGSTSSGAVAAGNITAGTGVTVTNGSNSITIGLTGSAQAIQKLIPNSGTNPVVPDGSGQVTLQGTGSITTVGGTNSLTVQLTGLTNHNVLIGSGTATITKIAPGSAGIPLVSTGVGSDPAFTTATVPGGGTGQTILAAHGVLIGEGTSAIGTAAPTATSGIPLVSNGSSADPSFTTAVVAGGGTGVTTLTGLALGSGTSPFTGVTYAEGTFTPVVTIGGTPVTSYFTQFGHYYQIGNLITFDCICNINNKGSGVGSVVMSLGTLPARANDGGVSILAVQFGSVTLSPTYVQFCAYILAGSSNVTMVQLAGTLSSNLGLTDVNINPGSNLFVSGSYYIA